MRTARAKGLREWTVILAHSLRAALIPVVTVLGLQFGGALAGAIVTESVFAWPGVGHLRARRHLQAGLPGRCRPPCSSWRRCYILTNLGVDLLYVVLDPRIREA